MMSIKCFLLVSVAVVVAVLSKNASAMKLINVLPYEERDPADLGQFPYFVGLKNKNPEENQVVLCGGSIVGPRHVLTQAMCISLMSQDLSIVAGCINYNGEDCQTYDVEKITPHPDFQDVFVNNVAVITLTEDFVFGENVQKIELAREKIEGEFTIPACGWDVYNDTMIWTTVTTLPDQECLDIWGESVPQGVPGYICTTSDTFAVMGTWGGPLVVEGKQIGIIGTADMNFTDIHIRTDYYMDFIDTVVPPVVVETTTVLSSPGPSTSQDLTETATNSETTTAGTGSTWSSTDATTTHDPNLGYIEKPLYLSCILGLVLVYLLK